MWRLFRKSCLILGLGTMACPVLSMGCLAQSQEQTVATSAAAAGSLKSFLQNYLRGPFLHEDKTTRYFDAWVDLNGDGKQEVVVYITGEGWCGSGGCITTVLEPKDSSYEVITKMTITRPPIRMLATRSHGWHNLTVWVQGGGILPGYEAELQFDGTTYPSNPSVLPARRLAEKVPGEIVIPASAFESGKLLYP